MKVIEHDPMLAREVYEVFASMTGRKRSSSMYWRWLQGYVKPMARAIARRGIVFIDPYDYRRGMATFTLKLPQALHNALEELAEELGVSKATLVRVAITMFLEALDELGGDGDAGGGD